MGNSFVFFFPCKLKIFYAPQSNETFLSIISQIKIKPENYEPSLEFPSMKEDITCTSRGIKKTNLIGDTDF